MKFCWSTLRVKDIEASIKFYTEIIGLTIESRFKAGNGIEVVFLGHNNKDEAKVELIWEGEERTSVIGNDISWGFEVESLDAAVALMNEKNIKIESGPIQAGPKIRYFFIKDPNGMTIQFVENMK